MTEPQALSKAELLEALRSSEREVVSKLSALSPDDLERGRYESGWNGREILAHIASMEWTYPRLVDVAREAAAPKGAAATPTGGFRGGTGDYNQRQVEKRAGASVADLLAEFRQNRAATIAAVEQADEALLATPIRSAGGITGPLARVFYLLAVMHVAGHVNDIVMR